MIHDMYLFQVKSAKESTTPWDYYKLVAKVPGEQAFTTVAESKCSACGRSKPGRAMPARFSLPAALRQAQCERGGVPSVRSLSRTG
jgi:hypothetical protein